MPGDALDETVGDVVMDPEESRQFMQDWLAPRLLSCMTEQYIDLISDGSSPVIPGEQIPITQLRSTIDRIVSDQLEQTDSELITTLANELFTTHHANIPSDRAYSSLKRELIKTAFLELRAELRAGLAMSALEPGEQELVNQWQSYSLQQREAPQPPDRMLQHSLQAAGVMDSGSKIPTVTDKAVMANMIRAAKLDLSIMLGGTALATVRMKPDLSRLELISPDDVLLGAISTASGEVSVETETDAFQREDIQTLLEHISKPIPIGATSRFIWGLPGKPFEEMSTGGFHVPAEPTEWMDFIYAISYALRYKVKIGGMKTWGKINIIQRAA